MPENEKQAADWEKKYNWGEQEFLETPMLPMQQVKPAATNVTTPQMKFPKQPLSIPVAT